MKFKSRKKRQKQKSLIIIISCICALIVTITTVSIIAKSSNNTAETTIPIDHIRVTKSSSDLVGQNYKEVTYIISEMGFKNIEYNLIDDLIIGFLVSEGEVENVFINGNSSFKKGDHFHEDSKVLISYHTFKS